MHFDTKNYLKINYNHIVKHLTQSEQVSFPDLEAFIREDWIGCKVMPWLVTCFELRYILWKGIGQ